MSNEEFIALAEKVAEGEASLAELAKYNAGYESFQENGTGAALPSNIGALEEKSLRDLLEIFGVQTKKIKLWPRIAVAAAAVAAITLGVWLYYTSSISGRHAELISASPLANDIAPGKNTATLTLANGKTILLDTNRTSVVVRDSVQVMTMLTASTPRGGTYQVTLPDGTKVWLNADSKISFPSQFNGKERKILLEGEAYFEVAKNKNKPFIVESGGQRVEVLGTHFNINSYADEGVTKTTLLEGSVDVNGTILKPNQQAILSTTQSGKKEIKVSQADTEEAMAWKEGYFLFDNDSFKGIMNKIARWYDVEVVYETVPKDLELVGGIPNTQNLSAVLKALESTGKVHFKLSGRRLIVYE